MFIHRVRHTYTITLRHTHTHIQSRIICSAGSTLQELRLLENAFPSLFLSCWFWLTSNTSSLCSSFAFFVGFVCFRRSRGFLLKGERNFFFISRHRKKAGDAWWCIKLERDIMRLHRILIKGILGQLDGNWAIFSSLAIAWVLVFCFWLCIYGSKETILHCCFVHMSLHTN